VALAAAKHLDAISFNCYDTDPRRVIGQYAALGKPLIIGEFSFRGNDSGLPNTRGAGPRVATQRDRAAAFRAYTTWALDNANIVGYPDARCVGAHDYRPVADHVTLHTAGSRHASVADRAGTATAAPAAAQNIAAGTYRSCMRLW